MLHQVLDFCIIIPSDSEWLIEKKMTNWVHCIRHCQEHIETEKLRKNYNTYSLRKKSGVKLIFDDEKSGGAGPHRYSFRGPEFLATALPARGGVFTWVNIQLLYRYVTLVNINPKFFYVIEPLSNIF